MNKILIILCLVLLTSCGPSQQEKKKVAAVTCSIMSETRNMDGAVRVREMNEARDKIGGEPFLSGDYTIKEAIERGLCQELVLGTYDESVQSLKDDKRERERIWEAGAEDRKIAAEKRAEEQRIADSKSTVKEEFHSNGQLKSRTNYQPKTDGGKQDGLYESYRKNGQVLVKVTYKDGKKDGLYEGYDSNGQMDFKSCWDNGEFVDMSYCEK